MKNIHVIPTDKPSRLLLSKRNNLQFLKDNASLNSNNHFEGTYQNIYITSNEEIKDYNWYISSDGKLLQFTGRNVLGDKFIAPKVITTTDQDLIKDSVQAIDDNFLEWFVKNPSCEEVEITKRFKGIPIPLTKGVLHYSKVFEIIIPKEAPNQVCENCKIEISKYGCACGKQEKPKQEALEEAKKKFAYAHKKEGDMAYEFGRDMYSFEKGAKWQAKKMYSEEEVIILLQKYRLDLSSGKTPNLGDTTYTWLEQNKKK